MTEKEKSIEITKEKNCDTDNGETWYRNDTQGNVACQVKYARWIVQ